MPLWRASADGQKISDRCICKLKLPHAQSVAGHPLALEIKRGTITLNLLPFSDFLLVTDRGIGEPVVFVSSNGLARSLPEQKVLLLTAGLNRQKRCLE